jgi:hypothetical protein
MRFSFRGSPAKNIPAICSAQPWKATHFARPACGIRFPKKNLDRSVENFLHIRLDNAYSPELYSGAG